MESAYPIIYPGAKRLVTPGANVTNMFPDGRPCGITIHYTADRDVARVLRVLDERDLAYHIIIDRDGTVIQNCYLINSCNHAGKAKWNGKSPNRRHLSVALMSYGLLHENTDGTLSNWIGQLFNRAESIENPDNVYNNKFYWDAATSLQVAQLWKFCLWCCGQGMSPDDICGHDECAIPEGRKTDPGGIMPFSMRGLREALWSTVGKH